MLSVIVYGRNDNHGYNMHKRIAISLNCIAEVLTHENDEILYVDYNTSNDLPTVIEAIADTLTDKAKKLTRVFRVREEIHARYKNKTHAQVNEPLARNIAIRRSNPQNKWILSTNTDMVFTPLKQGESLSDIVKNLPDAFYGIARFDVPEPLWESLDRKNPTNIIENFAKWGKTLHLNEIVYGNKIIKYDAPGDFQLMLRQDVFEIAGFDEAMILGWHVDSNLCKRMYLLRGEIQNLQDRIYGYHCNHTRMSGWMHRVKRIENSIEKFFENVTEAKLLEQENWGLANEEVEEIKIGKNDPTSNFPALISSIITPMEKNFTESFYNKEGYDKLYYSSDHVLPFLSEQFLNLSKKSNILYIGYNGATLDKIEKFCNKAGFDHGLYYFQTLPPEEDIAQKNLIFKLNPKIATKINLDEIVQKINLIIFDFGVEESDLKKPEILEFARRVIDNQSHFLVKIACQNNKNIIKTICINAHNSRYYKNIKKFFNPIQNPYCSGIMIGQIGDNIKSIKTFYLSILIKKIERYFLTKNIFLLTITTPIKILYLLAKYRFICYVKKLSLLKKTRIANKKIRKLIIKKEIAL